MKVIIVILQKTALFYEMNPPRTKLSKKKRKSSKQWKNVQRSSCVNIEIQYNAAYGERCNTDKLVSTHVSK